MSPNPSSLRRPGSERTRPPSPADDGVVPGQGRPRARRSWLPALVALALAPAAGADPEVLVERVEVRENHHLAESTLLYYVSTKPGDRYDEPRLRRDFRRLWSTGFLDDLVLDVQDGASGKRVIFRVRERPRIHVVDYHGSRALTTTKISERLKEDAPRVDTFYDPSKGRRVEGLLKRMLEDEGFPFAQVRHEARPLGTAGVQVSFAIEDGAKAFLKQIDFTGNTAFSDGALRRGMKRLKERGFWNLSWLTGKSVFSREKWEADQKNLQDFLLDRGRVDGSVAEPILTYSDGRAGLFKRRSVKWLRLEIPLKEGPAYNVGALSFEGLSVFKEDQVRPLFGLASGELYRDSRIRKGFERLRDAYGSRGYVAFTGTTRRQADPQRGVVDVVLHMDEDRRYDVGQISISGNDTTKDKVIRRELSLSEGDVLNTAALKDSVRRLNQLGYFKSVEPEIKPSQGRDDAYDLELKVQEQNRNQFQFTTSVSPVEGLTYTTGFSSSNFLGGGTTVQLAATRGSRYQNYEVGITEPYLFDQPISAGFDVAKRRLEVAADATEQRPGYLRDEIGTRLSVGRRLGGFTHVLADYSYSIIDVAPAAGGDPALVDAGRRHESRLVPSLVYSTVDHPLTPRRGLRLSGSLGLTGGPLGGTVNVLAPTLRAIGYVPVTRHTAFGLRAESGWLLPFSDTARLSPVTARNGIPHDSRFFLGGETQVRGFPQYDLGPRGPNGSLIGGNKYALASAEYYYDFGGAVRALLFADAGQAFGEGERLDLGRLKTSTGVELRFLIPVVNIPLRVYKAWNLNAGPGQKHSLFKVTFGTSF